MMSYLLVAFTFFSFIHSYSCQMNISVDNVLLEENQVVDVVETSQFVFECRSSRRVKPFISTDPELVADIFTGNDRLDGVRSYSISSICKSISPTVITCKDGVDTKSFILNVMYEPIYYALMPLYTTKENEPFMVTAIVDSNPPVLESDTVWLRNGMVIIESNRVQISSTTISIANVTRDDRGKYILKGNNTVGSANVSFDLEVYYGPDFANSGGNILVYEGQSLRVDCTVTDSNPVVVSVNISGYMVSLTLPSNDRVYEVEMVNSTFDGATFTCTASNGETMTQIIYTVTVTESPTSTSTINSSNITSSFVPPTLISINDSNITDNDNSRISSSSGKSSLSSGNITGVIAVAIALLVWLTKY